MLRLEDGKLKQIKELKPGIIGIRRAGVVGVRKGRR